MKVTSLNIGELTATVPIVQGGMGIGVSRSGLASAVAKEGGVGTISGAQIGFCEPDFETNSKEANLRAMRKEIRKAKEIAKGGILGVNLMVAMNNYKEMALACVEEGINFIVSGAGLPTDLPNIVKGSATKAIPIVSSGKAAATLLKLWEKKSGYIPDAVVLEGPEAGGHLGFSLEDLQKELSMRLSELIKEVKEAIKPFEDRSNKHISLIAGGGVFDGKDIAQCLKAGADGVQMSTRFVATEECDADIRYKEAYINSKEEEIVIIKSPVGLPGRAIRNDFIKSLDNGRIPVRKCYDCLKHCNPADTFYCISKALIEAVKGNVNNGLIFTGSNAYKVDKIVTVKELIAQLMNEVELYG